MEQEYANSLDLLYENAIRQNENILENFRALDTKSSILLAFLGIFIIPEIENFILFFENRPYMEFAIYFGISALLFNIIGIYYCFLALELRKINLPPNLEKLKSHYENGTDIFEIKEQLVSTFIAAAKENQKQVFFKIRNLNIVYWMSVLTLIAYVISKILFLLKLDNKL